MLTSTIHHQSIRKYICMLRLKSYAKHLTFIDDLDIAGHLISQRAHADCGTQQTEGELE